MQPIKSETEFNAKLQTIIDTTKYFLEIIGENELNAYKETLLPKTEKKSRELLDPVLNTIPKCIDVLNDIKNRSVPPLTKTIDDTLAGLSTILEDIKKNKPKQIHQSNFITHNHPISKVTKKDILRLTYYALIEHYEEFGWYNRTYKSEAIKKIRNKFGVNLENDNLEISLESIRSNDDKVLAPKNIPSKKLKYPTYGITM